MKSARRHFVTAAIAGALTATLGAAQAQTAAAYPSKPITVVVSYPPGGDTDAIARLFADKLSQRLKQPVVVDNKPGAGGALGNNFVGRAPADGYTLLFTPNPFTTAPLVMRLSPSASYDVLHGFEPIIKTAIQPLVLVANPAAGVKSVPDMIKRVQGRQAAELRQPRRRLARCTSSASGSTARPASRSPMCPTAASAPR